MPVSTRFFSEATAPASSEAASSSPGANGEPSPRPRRINPWRQFVGAFIPNWLLCRSEISQGAKLCYARLAQFAGKDGACFPRQETLAVELGVSERQARDYLRELGEFDLIESEQRGLGTSNSYAFLDHAWIYEGQPAMRATPFPHRQSASAPARKNASGQDRQETAAPTGEENQVEESNGTHTSRTRSGLPRSESEAVEAAKVAGVPEDFAHNEFNRMEAVNWVDGCQRQVRSWPHYIKQRWSREQSERAERQTRATARPARNGSYIPPRKFAAASYQQPVEKF
jgi:hypothetical protein